MDILVTGSSGLIGAALVSFLNASGHRVLRMVRKPARSGGSEIYWDPAAGKVDLTALEGIDAAVHLAGENISVGRWTREKMRRIHDSRVIGTRLLTESLASLSKPPQVLISTSAIGYYGDRGEEVLSEENGPGTGFLADVCREWENATKPATDKGIRVVVIRIGMVLSVRGGALERMLLPFRWGFGGKIGSGRQYMSWITLEELVNVICFVLQTESLHGPLNAVAPHPVTNYEFTKTLGKVLSRPTVFFLPTFAARLLFGSMADELLLASARVVPGRLTTSGYSFRFPNLGGALRHLFGNPATGRPT